MVEAVVGKTAVDKNDEKLGKIIRTDELLGKIKKEYESFAMILVRKFLKKDIVIPIETKKITKVEGAYTWFDITKTEFEEEVERQRKIVAEREIYTGTVVEATNRNRYYSQRDFTGLSQKRRERKR